MSARTRFRRTFEQIVFLIALGFVSNQASPAELPWGAGSKLPSGIFGDRNLLIPDELHDGLDFPGPMSFVYPIYDGIVYSCHDSPNIRERRLVLVKGSSLNGGTLYEYWHLDNEFWRKITDEDMNPIDCDNYDPFNDPMYVNHANEVGSISGIPSHLHVGVLDPDSGLEYREFPGREFPELIDCCKALDTEPPRPIGSYSAVTCPLGTVYEGEPREVTVCIEDVSGSEIVGINKLVLEDLGTSQPIANNTIDLTALSFSRGASASAYYRDSPDGKCRKFAYVVPGPAGHPHILKVTAYDYNNNEYPHECQPTLITRSITSLTATARQTDVRVSWHAEDFDMMVHFDILRSEDGGLTFSTCGSAYFLGNYDYEFIDTGVQYKKKYCYMIRDNEGGPGPDPDWGPVESSGRPTDLPLPPPISGRPTMSVAGIGANSVTVRIDAGCSPCDGYRVCVAPGPSGPWCDSGTIVPGCSNELVVDGLDEGADYWFRARAFCGDDLGLLSQTPRHARALGPPSMTIGTCSGGYLYAAWSGVGGSGCVAYVLSYQRMPDGPVISVETYDHYVAVPGLEWESRYCIYVASRDCDYNMSGPSVVLCSDTGNELESIQGDSAAAEAEEPILEVLGNPAFGRARLLLRGWRNGAPRLSVYDAGGRVVREIALADRGCGELCRVDWDGLDSEGKTAPRGVYFLAVTGGGSADTKRIVLLR